MAVEGFDGSLPPVMVQLMPFSAGLGCLDNSPRESLSKPGRGGLLRKVDGRLDLFADSYG